MKKLYLKLNKNIYIPIFLCKCIFVIVLFYLSQTQMVVLTYSHEGCQSEECQNISGEKQSKT
jgi:hypothetical protein